MGFKAFEKGMICKGKQYKEHTDFEESGADGCCAPGVMHYCNEPFDVWDYYPIVDENGNFTEYAEVKPLDKVLKDDNKRASKKLHIGAKLSLKDFIKAEVCYIRNQTTGDASRQAATGNDSMQAATGYGSRQVATGNDSMQAATGDASMQAATGYGSRQAATGKNCVSAVIGNNGKIKSALGNWIVLAEWGLRGDEYLPICVKSAQIDGKILKPNTWYSLKNGEFVEVAEDD